MRLRVDVSDYDPRVIAGPVWADVFGFGSAIVLSSERGVTLDDQPSRVIVTSTKAIKIAAAASLGAPTTGLHVVSTVAEQPIGRDETLAGARGRADAVEDSDAMIVSFENGIIWEPIPIFSETWRPFEKRYVTDRGVAVDRAAVVVRYAGRESVAWSDGVLVPSEYVLESQRRNRTITAGRLMASALGVYDTDWHVAFVGVPRAELLRRALRS